MRPAEALAFVKSVVLAPQAFLVLIKATRAPQYGGRSHRARARLTARSPDPSGAVPSDRRRYYRARSHERLDRPQQMFMDAILGQVRVELGQNAP